METAAKACALGTATHPPDPEKADADRGPTNADGAGTQGEGPAHRRVVHGLFVVLDASGINFLDLSGLKGLVDISRWAKGGGGFGGGVFVSNCRCAYGRGSVSESLCVCVCCVLCCVGRDLHVHGVRLLVARAKHRTRDMLRSSATLFHQLGGDKV